jgi:hypothetical protein
MMDEFEKKRTIDAYVMRKKGRLPTADEEKACRIIIDYVERNPVPPQFRNPANDGGNRRV